jgi:hypothetical protein
MKKYTKIEGTESKYLKAEVFYNKGGINYFTSRTEPRGYWASVTVVDVDRRENGVSIESFSLFGSGYKEFLFEVKKQSEKSYNRAVAEAGPVIEKIQNALLEKAGYATTPA